MTWLGDSAPGPIPPGLCSASVPPPTADVVGQQISQVNHQESAPSIIRFLLVSLAVNLIVINAIELAQERDCCLSAA